MSTAARASDSSKGTARKQPPYLFDTSFEEPGPSRFMAETWPATSDESLGFMPDGQTRDCSKRMHYAAGERARRQTGGRRPAGGAATSTYRNRIVLGNRKLTYRAVQMRGFALATSRRPGGRVPDRADQGRRAIQPVAGHSLQHLRLHVPDARLVPAIAAPRRRPSCHRSMPLESLPDGEPSPTPSTRSPDSGTRLAGRILPR